MTALTRKRAFATIKVVAEAMLRGETAISYSELAKRLGMPNETGRGLGHILDEAAEMCLENGLPDVTAVVVARDSIDRGEPLPSRDSFKDGIWPISGLSIEDVPAEQERVRKFDWRAQRTLGLA